MKKEENLTLNEMVKRVDDSKKVNPLDLSSDQDLTVALMNLISIEEYFLFSDAKTQKTGFYDLINTVRDMRKELMSQIVKESGPENGAVWGMSKHLLAASMRVTEVGTKALSSGHATDAYNLFNKAYDLYSLFWGINMGLIDLTEVKQIAPDIYERAISEYVPDGSASKKSEKIPRNQVPVSENDGGRSIVRRLGAWVKKTVNCCIE